MRCRPSRPGRDACRLCAHRPSSPSLFPPHQPLPAPHPIPSLSSPEYWQRPDEFDPDRFPLDGPVPNEVTENFAYLPFGGGRRKCVGDQFALFEAIAALAVLMRRFDFAAAADAPEVGMTTVSQGGGRVLGGKATVGVWTVVGDTPSPPPTFNPPSQGATIHTSNGLWLVPTPRCGQGQATAACATRRAQEPVGVAA